MQTHKMYSAFISSVYESLLDERHEVIDCLLDYNVFPICMEHFTVATSDKFEEIKRLIDDSDFFILLLGDTYGSCDSDGISWTEKEYIYASSRNMRIISIGCDNLGSFLKMSDEELSKLSDDNRKQVDFAKRINFIRMNSQELRISTIIGQVITRTDLSALVGWSRNSVVDTGKENDWRESHKGLNISGEWFHVHLSLDDEKYIRTGTVKIIQQFDSQSFSSIKMDGYNYSIRYNSDSGCIEENLFKRTHWSGDYTMREDGGIFGIFRAKREFSDTFASVKMERGIRRGIHDFSVPYKKGEITVKFEGEFHDEAPSPKTGMIYVFRAMEDRDNFIKVRALDRLMNNRE